MAFVHHQSNSILVFLLTIASVCKLSDTACLVKADYGISKECELVYIDPRCEKDIPDYLYQLPENDNPPKVQSLNTKHILNDGIGLTNLSWDLGKSEEIHGYKLKGFLLLEEIITGSYIKYKYLRLNVPDLKRFMKKSKLLHFSLENLVIPEVSYRSIIKTTVWSLIESRNKQRNKFKDNRSLCRIYAEKYEDYGVSDISEILSILYDTTTRTLPITSVKDHDSVNISVDANCSCWTDEPLDLNTDVSTVVKITSKVFCSPTNQTLVIKDTYISHEDTKINSSECGKCCVKFSRMPDRWYSLQVMFTCGFAKDERIGTCSFVKNITDISNFPETKPVHSQVMKISALVYVFVPFGSTCIISALIAVLIVFLRRRNRMTGDDITELKPMIGGKKVLFISYHQGISTKEKNVTVKLRQMLSEVGVQTTTAVKVFNQLFGDTKKMSPTDFKDRMTEKISKFQHFIIIATKDLCTICKTISNESHSITEMAKDESCLHYFLMKNIKGLCAMPNNKQVKCSIIAIEETSIGHCKELNLFVKSPVILCSKYCLIRHSKFNTKHFNRLVQSLPSKLPNNSLLEKLKILNTRSFIEIVNDTNNRQHTDRSPPTVVSSNLPQPSNGPNHDQTNVKPTINTQDVGKTIVPDDTRIVGEPEQTQAKVVISKNTEANERSSTHATQNTELKFILSSEVNLKTTRVAPETLNIPTSDTKIKVSEAANDTCVKVCLDENYETNVKRSVDENDIHVKDMVDVKDDKGVNVAADNKTNGIHVGTVVVESNDKGIQITVDESDTGVKFPADDKDTSVKEVVNDNYTDV